MSQLFASGGQSIGASSSASVLAMNIQCWFPFRIDWFYLLIAQGTLKSLLQHHNSKSSIFLVLSLLYDPTLTSIYYLITWSFVGKVMSLLFNMLSSFVIVFLQRDMDLLIYSCMVIVSELFTMASPSWVALHGIAHHFIELRKPLCHKAVVHEGVHSFISSLFSLYLFHLSISQSPPLILKKQVVILLIVTWRDPCGKGLPIVCPTAIKDLKNTSNHSNELGNIIFPVEPWDDFSPDWQAQPCERACVICMLPHQLPGPEKMWNNEFSYFKLLCLRLTVIQQ